MQYNGPDISWHGIQSSTGRCYAKIWKCLYSSLNERSKVDGLMSGDSGQLFVPVPRVEGAYLIDVQCPYLLLAQYFLTFTVVTVCKIELNGILILYILPLIKENKITKISIMLIYCAYSELGNRFILWYQLGILLVLLVVFKKMYSKFKLKI